MNRIDTYVLGLITEDEFSLWEIHGYVSQEFSLSGSDARDQSAASLRRLVSDGLATIYEVPSDDSASPARDVPLSTLNDDAAWLLEQSTLRAFATTLGTETYFQTGSTGKPRPT